MRKSITEDQLAISEQLLTGAAAAESLDGIATLSVSRFRPNRGKDTKSSEGFFARVGPFLR